MTDAMKLLEDQRQRTWAYNDAKKALVLAVEMEDLDGIEKYVAQMRKYSNRPSPKSPIQTLVDAVGVVINFDRLDCIVEPPCNGCSVCDVRNAYTAVKESE